MVKLKLKLKLKQRTMAHAAAIVLLMNLLNAHAAHALTPPAQASYLNANGAVAIMGDDAMHGIVQNLDASFARDYPSFRFVLETKGASTALPALTADVSALAPITRDAFDGERAGFRQVRGRDPVVIRVGYMVERPAVVIVNRRNAISGLTITQLMQVFTSALRKATSTSGRNSAMYACLPSAATGAFICMDVAMTGRSRQRRVV